jgi:hypothetical protein
MMTEQKPFYEIPKPPRKSYTIVVEEALPESAPLQCQYVEPIFNKKQEIIGYLTCCDTDFMSVDVYECDCCGRSICDDHMSKKHINGCYVCLVCEKLLPSDMKRIRALRLELNQ